MSNIDFGDCYIGKDFNKKTCRFVKGCRKGYSRDENFKCVKNLTNSTNSKRSVIKEKLNLLKELFSNSNGLVNSPTIRRTKSKRLIRTLKELLNSTSRKIYNEGNEIPNLEPIPLKQVKFKSPSANGSKRKTLISSRSNKTKGISKNSGDTTSKGTKKSRTFKSSAMTKEKIMNVFLNKFGAYISKYTWGEIKALARKDGIVLDNDFDKNLMRGYIKEYMQSYNKMTMKRALNLFELNEPYSKDELESIYKKKSVLITSNKMNEEEKQIEYQRLDKAYQLLNKKLQLSHISHVKTREKQDGTVFMFYSKSKDEKPGKGAGEIITQENIDKYKELSKIKDWRKKLSNFWISPFTLNDKQWQSVEHYYQASKYKGTPDFYNQFALDSGSELSKDPLLAKAAGGKTGKFNGKLIRPKSLVVDDGFFEDEHIHAMYQGQRAKFTQNNDLFNMLKLTKDAKLVHYTRGGQPVVFTLLMNIRELIKNKSFGNF